MAQRHRLEPGDWPSVFRRLEELVLANSGEDEFQEVFKLLVAKLHQEMFADDVSLLGPDAAATVLRVEQALDAADQRWPGMLAAGSSPKLSPDHQQVCVEALDELSLLGTSLEVMDALFEHLVSRSAKGSKGQYFTPRHVVEAVVQMVAPGPGELVADPACGSGGFLVHAMQHATRGMPDSERARYCRSHLWGFDIDQRAIQVGRALMLLLGGDPAHLYRTNSLVTTAARQQLEGELTSPSVEDLARAAWPQWTGFDAIITNPPFAGEVREPALLGAYELARRDGRRNERDVLFIERCVRLLRPRGRLAMVLPHNKIGGSQFAHVRDWLSTQARIVGVLSLGRNTFLPHTSQQADVVFALKRDRPATTGERSTERLILLTSEKDGKDSKGATVLRPGLVEGGSVWQNTDHDLDQAVAAFGAFVANERLGWGQP